MNRTITIRNVGPIEKEITITLLTQSQNTTVAKMLH